MKDCKTCGGDGAIPLYVGAKPCPCLTDRLKKLDAALNEVVTAYEDAEPDNREFDWVAWHSRAKAALEDK